jgi:hypothetical protein
MDNNKIETGNYTVTNEDGSYPLTNALSDIRSEVFRTSTTSTRITIDLGFPDNIKAFTLFAPLGETLGISKEATIKFQADNVSVWTSPEVDETLTLSSDDKLIYFTDVTYRFISIYIDDPTNPNGIVSFADIYVGDYTTTTLRNIAPKFSWNQVDKTKVSKSIDGTPYFSNLTKYDTFTSLNYTLMNEADRTQAQNLFLRVGISNWMPICIDPGSYITSSVNELTRLARFTKFSSKHVSKDRFTVSFSLEEVI